MTEMREPPAGPGWRLIRDAPDELTIELTPDVSRLEANLAAVSDAMRRMGARMEPRPDVPGPMPYQLVGGNWEGGTVDTDGQRWHHVANVGWIRSGPSPFFKQWPKRRRWWQRLWRQG